MGDVLKVYRTNRSIIKSALIVGIDKNIVLTWYVEGMKGKSGFTRFYDEINRINRIDGKLLDSHQFNPVYIENEIERVNDDYKISKYGDGWSYTTYVNDEKIFLISNDLNKLKEKVKSRKLPLR